MDHLTPILRSENMSKIRSKHTSPETRVRKFLSNNGFRYRLHDKSLPGKPDIVFKGQKFAIFINGCFWHQHKNCKRSTIPKTNQEYWVPKLAKNKERQKRDIRVLKRLGWDSMVIWECQSNNQNDLQRRLLKKIWKM